MDGYEDESFEEEDEANEERGKEYASGEMRGSYEVVRGDWKSISFDEVELGEQIGSGSTGLVRRGKYLGTPVALKTLVSFSSGHTERKIQHVRLQFSHDRSIFTLRKGHPPRSGSLFPTCAV